MQSHGFKSASTAHYYSLYKLASIHEEFFKNKHNIDGVLASTRQKKYYRPGKTCPVCMRLGYHSEIYDYQWLEYCPVHNEPLEQHCPECVRKWPTFSEMKFNNCKVCGNHFDFSYFIRYGISQQKNYEVCGIILDIIENRSKQMLSEITIGVPQGDDRLIADRREYIKSITRNSPISFAVLKQSGHIKPDECERLKKLKELDFFPMHSIKGKAVRVKRRHLLRPNSSNQLSGTGGIFEFYKSKLIYNTYKLKEVNHEIGTCINKQGICSSCLPWLLLTVIEKKDDDLYQIHKDIDWYNLMHCAVLLQKESSAFSMPFSKNINRLVFFLNEKTKKRKLKTFLKLPESFANLLLMAELSILYSHLVKLLKELPSKNMIMWMDMPGYLMDVFKKTVRAHFPVSVIRNENSMMLVIPKKLIDDSIYISGLNFP